MDREEGPLRRGAADGGTPKVTLARGPTPVCRAKLEGLRHAELWIKNDGVIHPVCGGNKVRKLERILAEAQRRESRRLVTVGAAGSHHVLATCWFARQFGLPTAAVLTRQPWSANAERTLRASLACGLDARAAPSPLLVPVKLLSLLRPRDLVVPVGGSSVVGVLGYIDAARELADQIRANEVPEPDVLVAALGSGGTVAGLLAGVVLEGLRTKVVGVTVATPRAAARTLALSLAWRAASLHAGRGVVAARALSRALVVDCAWLGRGYGHRTEAGTVAAERAAAIGLELEPTYTEKAFAGALALAGAPGLGPSPDLDSQLSDITNLCSKNRPLRVLYWHTHSAASLDPLLKSWPAESKLPRRLCALLDSR